MYTVAANTLLEISDDNNDIERRPLAVVIGFGVTQERFFGDNSRPMLSESLQQGLLLLRAND